MTPILIRSKDRVDYLYTTLKSLTGTILNDAYVVIVDDCSESDEMKKFLYSNDEIKLKNIGWKQQIKNDVKEKSIYFFNPNNLTDNEMWEKYIGNCPKNFVFCLRFWCIYDIIADVIRAKARISQIKFLRRKIKWIRNLTPCLRLGKSAVARLKTA